MLYNFISCISLPLFGFKQMQIEGKILHLPFILMCIIIKDLTFDTFDLAFDHYKL